jgi:maleylacetoacetate isomerase
MPDILLYAYWRSAASYRVRAALALKGLEATEIEVDLSIGAQKGSEYRRINPQAIVPTLVHDGTVIHQSLAIVEYLDEVFPARPLLPADPVGRARVRAIAVAVAAEIQGRTGTRVREYLEERWDSETMRDWYRHWGRAACEGVEGLLADHPDTGVFCHGDTPGMADCFLYPQVCALRRREVDLSGFPTILRIADACAAEPAFIAAAPDNHASRAVDLRF